MTKNKICKNCGCFDVCIFANPYRTEDCNHGWQPVITYCKNCTDWDPDNCHPGFGWCDKNIGYRPEHWFCAFGNARTSDG